MPNAITAKSFKIAIMGLRRKFSTQPPLIEDSSRDVCFVGDVHGDVETVKYVRKISKEFEKVVWLGDFVDRGTHDIEVVMSISKLGSKNVILAGNHDAYKEVIPRDFHLKLEESFGPAWPELDDLYIDAFRAAPIAYFNTNYKLLALHGFIPIDEKNWNFKTWKKVEDGEVPFQILWNDPAEVAVGWRGEGTYIVPSDVTKKFFQRTGIQVIVRSHQPRTNQIFSFNSNKIVNLGSSSFYGTRAIFILPDFKFVYF